MGFGRFAITLDNPSGFFSPGQTIVGCVHVTNNKPESITGIRVECSGLAEVRFPSKNRREMNTAEAYDFHSAREQYFDAKFSLYNPARQAELDAGQHQYPFSFMLPTQIPSSFEGPHGHVRYTIRAVAQRPWLKREYECKTTLTVYSILDLNTIPEASLPVRMLKTKTLGCFCCLAGPVTAQARIDRAGYVPGESIILNADTENESGISMRGSKAQFVQITKFMAEGETKLDSKVLQLYNHEDFRDADVMEAVPFLVSQLPPSTLPFCGIMDISYQIQYIVDPGAMSINLTLSLDVLIGTIPLRQSVPTAPVLSNASYEALDHWTLPDTTEGEWSSATTPPPSYEDSIRIPIADSKSKTVLKS